ncbi:MAG: hypothetical protein L0H63_15415 [Nitrococcus sp.]|nr:hypothetical protein [Nitrococcus sp.]
MVNGTTYTIGELAHGEECRLPRYVEILNEKRQMLLHRLQDVDDALAVLEDSERRCRAILEQRIPAARPRRSVGDGWWVTGDR